MEIDDSQLDTFGPRLLEVLFRIDEGRYTSAKTALLGIQDAYNDPHYWIVRSVFSAVKGEKSKAKNLATNASKLEGYSARLHGDVLLGITANKLSQGSSKLVRADVFATIRRLYHGYEDRLPGVLALEGLQATSEGRYEDAIVKHSAAREAWKKHPHFSTLTWVRNMVFHNDLNELIALALSGEVKSEKGQALLRELSSEPRTKKDRRLLAGIKAFGRTTGHAFLLSRRMSFQFRRLDDYLFN